MIPSHYEILGVPIDASLEQIRAAYRRLARIHHPDRPEGSATRMQAINEAFAVIGDASRRRAYDTRLGLAPPPRSSTSDGPAGARQAQPKAEPRPGPPPRTPPIGPTAPGFRPYRGGSTKLVDACRSRRAGKLAAILAIAPTLLFVSAVVAGLVSMMLTSRVLLGIAFLMFGLSVLTMVTAALLELVRSSASSRHRH